MWDGGIMLGEKQKIMLEFYEKVSANLSKFKEKIK